MPEVYLLFCTLKDQIDDINNFLKKLKARSSMAGLPFLILTWDVQVEAAGPAST